VNTPPAAAAADDDDDASQCDVIDSHPEHLLRYSLGSCSTTKLVLYKIAVLN